MRSTVGRFERIRALVVAEIDLNAIDVNGQTPLMVAASVGSPEVVKMLIEPGADVKLKDKLGYYGKRPRVLAW